MIVCSGVPMFKYFEEKLVIHNLSKDSLSMLSLRVYLEEGYTIQFSPDWGTIAPVK